jgi:hypothetical protein
VCRRAIHQAGTGDELQNTIVGDLTPPGSEGKHAGPLGDERVFTILIPVHSIHIIGPDVWTFMKVERHSTDKTSWNFVRLGERERSKF